MHAYIYKAALLCEDCAAAARRQSWQLDMSDRQDSGKYPQGPLLNGGGEADSPQSCDHCFCFLENPLTSDGEAYAREIIARDLSQGCTSTIALSQWAPFYGLQPAVVDCCSVLQSCDSMEGRWPRWRA